MMKHLDIWDRRGPNVFLSLSDIVPLLNARSRASIWEVDDFIEPDGERYFETVADGHDLVREAAATHARFTFTDLEQMGGCIRQIIWGRFKAFNDGSDQPWLILSAVDSTFWRVETADLPTRQLMLKHFKDVRMGGA
jgi:hypothetical protein